jgi:hypothetical protein
MAILDSNLEQVIKNNKNIKIEKKKKKHHPKRLDRGLRAHPWKILFENFFLFFRFFLDLVIFRKCLEL